VLQIQLCIVDNSIYGRLKLLTNINLPQSIKVGEVITRTGDYDHCAANCQQPSTSLHSSWHLGFSVFLQKPLCYRHVIWCSHLHDRMRGDVSNMFDTVVLETVRSGIIRWMERGETKRRAMCCLPRSFFPSPTIIYYYQYIP
jgi:hypothetical protein